MRFMLVRRSRLKAAQDRAERLKARYDLVWKDHLSRCDCHDCYDQCGHAEDGRHTEDCGCCQWCG
ncbi:MAG: hypothetical protein ACRDV9_12435 [Acidimicrobiia bacterium]